jgi:hypothetical protein
MTGCGGDDQTNPLRNIHFILPQSTQFVHHDPELALQQIEAQNPFSLSRILGTPNISSKGVLEQRVVSVPATLFPPGHRYRAPSDKTSTKKLIEEVADSSAAPSDVDGSKNSAFPSQAPSEDAVSYNNSASGTPAWTWRQEDREIRIIIQVPKLVRIQTCQFFFAYTPTLARPTPRSRPQPWILNLAG